MVGATVLPIGFPTPVAKRINWQPPAARPVSDSTAGAGVSMKWRPGEEGGTA